MPQQIRAIVVDPTAPGKLAIKPVELRDPDRDEVAVRVTAISLNRGETRRALQVAEAGWRPGWDFAGLGGRRVHDGRDPLRLGQAGARLRFEVDAQLVAAGLHAVGQVEVQAPRQRVRVGVGDGLTLDGRTWTVDPRALPESDT